MRHFETPRAQGQSKVDHGGQTVDRAAVDHEIDGQRQANPANSAGGLDLFDESARPTTDLIIQGRVRGLDRQLDMIQAGLSIDSQLLFRHPGRNQIAVEADSAAMVNDVRQVAAAGRLTTGKMHLQDAKCGRFAEYPSPVFERKFAAAAFQLQRIGAIGAAQRATMGQFGKQAERRRRLVVRIGRRVSHRLTMPLSAMSRRN